MEIKIKQTSSSENKFRVVLIEKDNFKIAEFKSFKDAMDFAYNY
jgi:hypothetical protein